MVKRTWTKQILKKISKLNILVIGDIMLDAYLWGKVNRISPEAPVPVVRVVNKTFNLGGAANVAKNLISLNANVSMAGIIGNDDEGSSLVHSFKESGIDHQGIFRDPERSTTLKTRVMAHDHQVVRIDQEADQPLSGKVNDQLIDFINKRVPECDAVIVSDYGKGVIHPGLLENLIHSVNKHSVICAIDPKIKNFEFYKNVTVIKPNHHEASMACGLQIDGIELLQKAGNILLEKTNCSMVLITWGKNGMGLFEKEKVFHHIETVSKRVYDVTGAGDTVIAIFTLGLAAGASPFEAAVLSNLAAGIVVSNVGTASVTPEELIGASD